MRESRPYAVVAVIMLFLSSPSYAFTCNECHSKNPSMVRMHEALEFKGCAQCHFPGRIQPPKERETQKRSDSLCSRCHGQAGISNTRSPIGNTAE